MGDGASPAPRRTSEATAAPPLLSTRPITAAQGRAYTPSGQKAFFPAALLVESSSATTARGPMAGPGQRGSVRLRGEREVEGSRTLEAAVEKLRRAAMERPEIPITVLLDKRELAPMAVTKEPERGAIKKYAQSVIGFWKMPTLGSGGELQQRLASAGKERSVAHQILSAAPPGSKSEIELAVRARLSKDLEIFDYKRLLEDLPAHSLAALQSMKPEERFKLHQCMTMELAKRAVERVLLYEKELKGHKHTGIFDDDANDARMLARMEADRMTRTSHLNLVAVAHDLLANKSKAEMAIMYSATHAPAPGPVAYPPSIRAEDFEKEFMVLMYRRRKEAAGVRKMSAVDVAAAKLGFLVGRSSPLMGKVAVLPTTSFRARRRSLLINYEPEPEPAPEKEKSGPEAATAPDGSPSRRNSLAGLLSRARNGSVSSQAASIASPDAPAPTPKSLVAAPAHRSLRRASLDAIMASVQAYSDKTLAQRSLSNWRNISDLFEGYGRYAEDDAALRKLWAADNGILPTAETIRAIVEDAVNENADVFVDACRPHVPSQNLASLRVSAASAYFGNPMPPKADTDKLQAQVEEVERAQREAMPRQEASLATAFSTVMHAKDRRKYAKRAKSVASLPATASMKLLPLADAAVVTAEPPLPKAVLSLEDPVEAIGIEDVDEEETTPRPNALSIPESETGRNFKTITSIAHTLVTSSFENRGLGRSVVTYSVSNLRPPTPPPPVTPTLPRKASEVVLTIGDETVRVVRDLELRIDSENGVSSPPTTTRRLSIVPPTARRRASVENTARTAPLFDVHDRVPELVDLQELKHLTGINSFSATQSLKPSGSRHISRPPAVVAAPTVHKSTVVTAMEQYRPGARRLAADVKFVNSSRADRPATPPDVFASHHTKDARWWTKHGYDERHSAGGGLTDSTTSLGGTQIFRKLSKKQSRLGKAKQSASSSMLETRAAQSQSLPVLQSVKSHALGAVVAKQPLPVLLSPLRKFAPIPATRREISNLIIPIPEMPRPSDEPTASPSPSSFPEGLLDESPTAKAHIMASRAVVWKSPRSRPLSSGFLAPQEPEAFQAVHDTAVATAAEGVVRGATPLKTHRRDEKEQSQQHGPVSLFDRLCAVWDKLHIPASRRLDFVIKYSTPELAHTLVAACETWENTAKQIYTCERVKLVCSILRGHIERPATEGVVEPDVPTIMVLHHLPEVVFNAEAAPSPQLADASTVISDAWTQLQAISLQHITAYLDASTVAAFQNEPSLVFRLGEASIEALLHRFLAALQLWYDSIVATTITSCDVLKSSCNGDVATLHGIDYAAALVRDPYQPADRMSRNTGW
jgi:hypothetical protein